MTNTKRIMVCALLCVLGGSGVAYADSSGTLVVKDQATVFEYAYAYRHADDFDKTKQVTTVMFSDKSIDAAKINAATDRWGELRSQLRALQANRIEMNIKPDGDLQTIDTMVDGSLGQRNGSGWYKIDLKQNDDKRIEGTFRSTDEKDKKEGLGYLDLKFALNLPPPPYLGTLLPADGGEPGKVYRAYSAALGNGDVEAMTKLMPKERADEILAHRKDANFQPIMKFMQGSAIKDPKFDKSYVNGDKATLSASGKNQSGADTDTTVSMVKEGGAWRVANEMMHSR